MKKDIFAITILLLLTYFFWKHIPTLQFQGEGFYYFSKIPHIEEQNLSRILQEIISIIDFPLAPDAFALAFFNLVEPIFKDRVELYFWTVLVTMLMISIAFYYLCKLITQKSKFALMISMLLSLNFIANFDMFSGGFYQYFVQRGVLLLPLLLALLFLILYFQNNKLRYYFISILLYLLSVCLGFFATWFIPPFVFYPIFYLLVNFKQNMPYILKYIFMPLPFVLGNILLIKDSTFYSQETSFIFFLLFKIDFIVKGLIHQLSVLTLPIGTVQFLFDHKKLGDLLGISISQNTVTVILAIFLITLYLSATIFVLKLYPKWRVIILVSLASLVSILILNIYKNAATVMASPESSRYYYYPFVMSVIFWGITLAGLVSLKKLVLKYFILLFFAGWMIHNYQAIQRTLKEHRWRYDANKDTINVIRSLSDQLKKEPSYVYLSSPIGPYGTEFLKRYYSHKDGQFYLINLMPEDYLDELVKNNINIDMVYLFRFDEGLQKVVDNTPQIRAKLREIKGGIK